MEIDNSTQSEVPSPYVGLFEIRNANQWIEKAKTRPIPKMLFDVLWYEGEINILFADSNVGKSILAVQIADSISKGKAIPGFRLEQPDSQKLLYFDFELSDKQFETRYSENYSNHYQFSENLQRVEINADAELPDSFKNNFEAYLLHSLVLAIERTKAQVLIIDNITYLRNDTERAKDALPLMKELKALKNRYNLSILVLAHTPKRDMARPLTMNDLGGSSMLMNFCDSAFAIGKSVRDEDVRYIKQIKERSSEKLYGADNVCVCRIRKHSNFLGFDLSGHSEEREHLRERTEKDTKEIDRQIKEMKEGNPALSVRDIAKSLNTNKTRVQRALADCSDGIDN